MRIRKIEARLCDVAALTAREDAIQAFPKQETILVDIETEEGLVGTATPTRSERVAARCSSSSATICSAR